MCKEMPSVIAISETKQNSTHLIYYILDFSIAFPFTLER